MSAWRDWLDNIIAAPRAGEPGRQSAEAVLTRHAGQLMKIRGVMSIGIGKDDDGHPAIVVGVTSDAPDAVGTVPQSLDGVRVIKRTF